MVRDRLLKIPSLAEKLQTSTPSRNYSIYSTLFDANISSIQRIVWCFLALGHGEPYSDWRNRLPGKVNKCLIRYIFGEHATSEEPPRKISANRSPVGEAMPI